MAYKVITPCHENWDGMSPVEKGRYCSVCKKDVLDLTAFPDQPVPEGSCGRIYATTTRIETYKSLRLLALGVTAAATLSQTDANAQTLEYGEVPKESGQVCEKKDSCGVRRICLSGTVRDKETKETLPFANVIVKQGTKVVAGAITDMDGVYKLEIPRDSLQGNSFDIRVVYVGYEEIFIKDVPVSKSSYAIDLSLASGTKLLGMIIQEVAEPEYPWPFDGQSGRFIDNESYKHMPK